MQPQNLYRGNVARISDRYTQDQIDFMIAIEHVASDMQRVRRGSRTILDYELNVTVSNREEWNFAFNEIQQVMRLYSYADPAFDASNWEGPHDMPGDSFRYWICRADEEYIGINVRWELPDAESQTKINETAQVAAMAYA